VALDNDADLVPVMGFGENNAFFVMHTEENSTVRQYQKWLQKKLGFSIPIFWGRGVGNYSWG
jgi:hypothetical protein